VVNSHPFYGDIMQRVTILTREQISKLSEIADKFPDVPQVEIWEKSDSGIGVNDYVKFDHGSLSVTIDITDVSNW